MVILHYDRFDHLSPGSHAWRLGRFLVAIDPGNEPSAPKTKLETLIDFIERHPSCTLAGGEGFLLVQRIRTLELDVRDLHGRLLG